MMESPLGRTSLRQRLLEEDAFVRKLIDTVPPKVYFNHEINEYLEEGKHEFIDSNMKSYGGVGKKMKVKGKHKRARFNPLLHKTVTQIQEDLEQMNGKAEIKAGANESRPFENPMVLQEKLTQKIETMKAKRIGQNGPQKKSVKEKQKESKKKRKRKNKTHKAVAFEVTEKSESKKEMKSEGPVFNKDAKIVYSKFDFGEGQDMTKEKPSWRKNKFKRTLNKIKDEKEKLETLSSTDPEKAERISQKIKWKAALNKSEGIKIKDNPEMLKKSMKRQEQKKKKSQKKWEDRADNVKKDMEDRQSKRMKNIRARKQQKIDKKIKRARKKGRLVNGV